MPPTSEQSLKVALLVQRFSAAIKNGASSEVDSILVRLRYLCPGVRFYARNRDLYVYCPVELVDQLPRSIRYTASYIESVHGDGTAYVVKSKTPFRGHIERSTENNVKPPTWHARLDQVFDESA